MTSDEIPPICPEAGNLPWIASCTSPNSYFQVSVALQRKRDQKFAHFAVLRNTRQALSALQSYELPKSRYIPLNNDIVHLKLYNDTSFQNLVMNHSKIGFVIGIADKNDHMNVFHWQRSSAPRRPHSTQESELMALDFAWRCKDKVSMIFFNIFKRIVSVVAYVDCKTL